MFKVGDLVEVLPVNSFPGGTGTIAKIEDRGGRIMHAIRLETMVGISVRDAGYNVLHPWFTAPYLRPACGPW